ncbi:MAG: hypothetical protein K6U14_08880 [Firmicutes bacterium]|nr:hypothetical protein [Alicyclobacillaceae bacterium]MCL6497724.1 hypothetical protein [Bacillota bacterium]
MRGRDDLQRAEYYLFAWQVREVQRLARQSGLHPSQVMRQLLTQVLAPPPGKSLTAAPSGEAGTPAPKDGTPAEGGLSGLENAR